MLVTVTLGLSLVSQMNHEAMYLTWSQKISLEHLRAWDLQVSILGAVALRA